MRPDTVQMLHQPLKARAAARRQVAAHVTKARRKYAQSSSANQSRAAVDGTQKVRRQERESEEEEETRTEKVYIGQGRYVDDDPRKYPDKNSLGVGGWAGGEQGARAAACLLCSIASQLIPQARSHCRWHVCGNERSTACAHVRAFNLCKSVAVNVATLRLGSANCLAKLKHGLDSANMRARDAQAPVAQCSATEHHVHKRW